MKNEMFSVANATDSSGAFILEEYHTNTQPFEKDNDSNIVYKGDRGTNAVAVSETRTMNYPDGGSVFMAVKSGNSVAPMFAILGGHINSIRTASESVVEATAVVKQHYKLIMKILVIIHLIFLIALHQ